MKGMTNNQIIMNEAAKLDPATLHAIATAHHTPEQIAAMAANAVTTDENGDEQPATIADVEIILAAAELHTFDHWKKEGKSVKLHEKALIECYLWKYTTKPSKEQREKAAAEGKEAAPDPHYYPTKSHLFSCLQVESSKPAPQARFKSTAEIIAYNKRLQRKPPQKLPPKLPAPRRSSLKSTTNFPNWFTLNRFPRNRPRRSPAPRRSPPPTLPNSKRQNARQCTNLWPFPKPTAPDKLPRWKHGARRPPPGKLPKK